MEDTEITNITYDPFTIDLVKNWIFDEYATEEGGDTIDNLYTSFIKIILQDPNIIKIFNSEIKSKSPAIIINRMNTMLERVIDVKKRFRTNVLSNSRIIDLLKKPKQYSSQFLYSQFGLQALSVPETPNDNLLNTNANYEMVVKGGDDIIYEYI